MTAYNANATSSTGGSLYTNGNYQLIANSPVEIQGGFTISTWIYPTVTPSNFNQYIVSKGKSYYIAQVNPDHSAYHLAIGGTQGGHAGHLIFYFDNTPILISTTTIPLNTWTHISVMRLAAGGATEIVYYYGMLINGQINVENSTTIAQGDLATQTGGTFMIGDYSYFPDGLSVESGGYETYSFKGYIHGFHMLNIAEQFFVAGNFTGYTPAITPAVTPNTTLLLNSVDSAHLITDSSGHHTFTNNGFTWSSNKPS